jgi:hypothetical protein
MDGIGRLFDDAEAEDNGPMDLHVVDIAERRDTCHGRDAEQNCQGGEDADILQVVRLEAVQLRTIAARDMLLIRAPILAKKRVLPCWQLGPLDHTQRRGG